MDKWCPKKLLALGHYGERCDIHFGNWDTLCLSEDVYHLVTTDIIDISPLSIFDEAVQLGVQSGSQNPTGMESISWRDCSELQAAVTVLLSIPEPAGLRITQLHLFRINFSSV